MAATEERHAAFWAERIRRAGCPAVWVVPFALAGGAGAGVASLDLSALVLLALGAGIALLTGRSVAFSAARQADFGLGAALVVFGVGPLLGVVVG